MQGVTVSQAFSFAWNRFGANWLTFLGIIILSVIVGAIPVVGQMAQIFIFYPALARAALLAVRQGRVSFEEAFSPFGKLLEVGLFEFLVALVPLGVAFITGTIGVILLNPLSVAFSDGESILYFLLAFLFQFFLLYLFQLFFWSGSYFILDGKKSIGGAFGASLSLFSQHFGKTVGLMLVSVVVILLGLLACCVGIFIALPVVHIAWAAMYVGLTEGKLPETGGAPTQA